MTTNQIQKEIQKHMNAVAKRRDLLDESIDTLVHLRECCSEAYDNLQMARDALSELV